jgi:hypothetical protein
MYDQASETHLVAVKGLQFSLCIRRDDYGGTPWDQNEECHGPVRYHDRGRYNTHSSKPTKRAGERELGESYLYDWAGAMKKAKAEGWGPRTPYRTATQAAEAAVQRDYDYLKAWCEDDWCNVSVEVRLVGGDEDDDYTDTLGFSEWWTTEPDMNNPQSKNHYVWEEAVSMAEHLANRYYNSHFREYVLYVAATQELV